MKASKVRKQISQQTFDECVQENMEDFDMSLDEATADAIAQFESQHVDLSNIIKSASAVDEATGQIESPVERLQRTIEELHAAAAAMQEQKQHDAEQAQRVLVTLTTLQQMCDELPEARVLAGRNNAIDPLLSLLAVPNPAVVEPTATLLTLLCAENTDNQDFLGARGMEAIASTLSSLAGPDNDAGLTAEQSALAARLCVLARSACTKHEANKAHFTKAQGVDSICAHLESAKRDASLSRHLASVLRVLTIHDDPNAQFSSAHDVIKLLVGKDLVEFILTTLRENQNDTDVLVSWLIVLKQLAITEDTCKNIHDRAGLDLLYHIMSMHETNAAVVKRCITVFRNVAAADEIKQYIIQTGGLQQLLMGMQRHSSDASLQQNACATLAALALRSPENSRCIVEMGAARQISAAMQQHRDNIVLLRQASLAIRNLVARSVELRVRILEEEEIEALLRDAQTRRGCGDEAYAALRDLGCDIKLASFGTVVPTVQFNPVNIQSNKLLNEIDEAAEAPFASAN